MWIDAAGRLRPAADTALALLRDAGDQGLEPADYRSDGLNQLSARVRSGSVPRPDVLAAFDAALTAAMEHYLRDLHTGRVDPRSLGFRFRPRDDLHDIPTLLRAAIETNTIIELAADWSRGWTSTARCAPSWCDTGASLPKGRPMRGACAGSSWRSSACAGCPISVISV